MPKLATYAFAIEKLTGKKKIRLLTMVLLLGAAGNLALATNSITLDSGIRVDRGTSGIQVNAEITHDDPIHAFSLALTFDPGVLSLTGISFLNTAIAIPLPDFFFPTINNVQGMATLGVIFSYADQRGEIITRVELAASPTIPQKVAVLSFDVAADAAPGEHLIELQNNLGFPPIGNVFSNEGTTIHIDPVLMEAGSIIVNNENVFMMPSDINGTPGARVQVTVSAKHPDPLQGYEFAIVYDKSVLTFGDATTVGTDAAFAVLPEEIEFFFPQVEPDFSPTMERLGVGAVVDNLPPFADHVIPPSPASFQSVARVGLDVANDPFLVGTSTDLFFNDSDVVGAITNLVIINQQSFGVDKVDGRITFVDQPIFWRGDFSNDGRIDISDPIRGLSYIFQGGPAPVCLNAADINDDERLDLSDTVYTIRFLFLGGEAPRPPYPACGIDPTPSTSTCGGSAFCAP